MLVCVNAIWCGVGVSGAPQVPLDNSWDADNVTRSHVIWRCQMRVAVRQVKAPKDFPLLPLLLSATAKGVAFWKVDFKWCLKKGLKLQTPFWDIVKVQVETIIFKFFYNDLVVSSTQHLSEQID